MKNYQNFRIENSFKSGYVTNHWCSGNLEEINEYFSTLHQNRNVDIVTVKDGDGYLVSVIDKIQ